MRLPGKVQARVNRATRRLAVRGMAKRSMRPVPARKVPAGEEPAQKASAPKVPDSVLDGMKDRAERSEERLKSPSSVRARAASRTEFRDQSSSEALETAEAAAGNPLEVPIWDGLTLAGNQEVVSYVTPTSAIVETDPANGPAERSVVGSDVPLRSTEGDGSLKPVDLDLERGGAGFEPANPLVATSIPTELADGLKVGESSGLRLSPAESSDSARLVEGRVFYANVDQGHGVADTDVVITPEPRGAEMSWQLRSPASPEALKLDLDLPAGAAVELTSDPQVAKIVRDGKVLSVLSPVIAVDADGRSVKARYELDRGDLVVRVDHRSQDLRYPLFVDPHVADAYQLTYSTPSDTGGVPTGTCDSWESSGWAWWTTHPTKFAKLESCGVLQATGSNTFTAGNYSEWYFTAPRTTYINRVDFNASHTAGNSCVAEGTWSFQTNSWEQGTWHNVPNYNPVTGPEPWFNVQGNPASPNYRGNSCVTFGSWAHAHNPGEGVTANPNPYPYAGNAAVFMHFMKGNSTGSNSWLNGSLLWFKDRDNPTLSELAHPSPAPAGWTKNNVSMTSTVKATDGGFGPGMVTFYIPEDGGVWDFGAPYGTYRPVQSFQVCNPVRKPFCGTTLNGTATYNTSTMPEGDKTVMVNASDAALNTSGLMGWHVRIDRTAPTIATPTGDLYENRNRPDDHRKEGIYTNQAKLHTTITDTLSGAKSAKLAIDRNKDGDYTDSGEDINPDTTPNFGCAQTGIPAYEQCSTTAVPVDYTLNTTTLNDNDYNLQLTATDQAGSTKTLDTWTITVDRQGDIYAATESTVDPTTVGAEIVKHWSRLAGWESRVETPDEIATRRTAQCPGASTPQEQCGEVRDRLLVTAGALSADDGYNVTIGESPDDPRLERVSDLTHPVPPGPVVGSGPIAEAALPWQVLPPAHASTYDYHRYSADGSTNEGDELSTTIHTWVDAATKLPIKVDVTRPDGTESDPTYFSYGRSRKTADELPSDHFAIPRPSAPTSEDQSEYRGASRAVPAVATDRETGSTFRPMRLNLVPQLTLPTGLPCLIGGMLFKSDVDEPNYQPEPTDDPDEAPDRSGPITAVDVTYSLVPSATGCNTSTESFENASLTVSAYARSSTVGQQWLDNYRDEVTTEMAAGASPTLYDTRALLVGGEAATLYLAPFEGGEITALLATSDTVVTLNGSLLRDIPILNQILATLEIVQ